MARMPCWTVLALSLGVLWGGVGSAGPRNRPAKPPVPAAAPVEEISPDATRHFQAGRDLVDAGKFAEGVIELQAACQATCPRGLAEAEFYLGLAYDGLRRTDPAILAYRRYLALAEPTAVHAPSVRERLALLERRRGPDAPPLIDADALRPAQPATPAGTPAATPANKVSYPPLRVPALAKKPKS